MKLMRLVWLRALLVSLGALGLALAGCSTAKQPGRTASGAAAGGDAVAKGQTGVELWSQNCGHCHNIRSPDSYSVSQWDVAMLHMRIRANLTPREHKAILEFLQSGHRGPAVKTSKASSSSEPEGQ